MGATTSNLFHLIANLFVPPGQSLPLLRPHQLMLCLLSLFLLLFPLPTATQDADHDYADRYGAHVEYPPLANQEPRPSAGERWVHHMFNIVRVSPTDYRAFGYGSVADTVILPATYPPVNPIWFHPTLIEAARAQGEDLAENCGGLAHASCDGTGPSARVQSFFPCGFSGENGALGYSSSGVTDGWLWDGGALDGQSGDGHRRAIMSSGHTMVGIGQYRSYIFADFSRCDSIYGAETHPIYSATHKWSGSTLKMMAMFHLESASPGSISGTVRLDGVKWDLVLEFGEGNHGHWVYEADTSVPEGEEEPVESCYEYYFQFTEAGTGREWQYPAMGSMTAGTGENCEGWVSSALVAEKVVVAKVLTGVLTAASIVGLIVLIVVILVLTMVVGSAAPAAACICCKKDASRKTSRS